MRRLAALVLAVSLCAGLPNSMYGKLTSPDELAVSNSVTNVNELADFSVRFVPDTTIPAGGVLDVQFPSQFALGLGLSSAVCSDPCSVFNRTVTFRFSASVMARAERRVVVYNVLNPSVSGGTAFFQLKSWSGNNLLDANLAFAAIGIERAITAMTTGNVQISSTTSSKAGEIGAYRFSFKPNRFLPAYSWLRFTFPNNGFTLSQYPACQTFAVNGKTVLGTLSCATSGRQVQLTGISEDIQAGTEIGIAVTATNPPQSGTTGFFWIETGRNRTNTVYERITTVPGLAISPGRINAKYFSQTDGNVKLTRGNPVLFTLRFTPTNPIEAGGLIKVHFNNNFNMDNTPHYWVNYGLDDLSSTQPVTWAYSSATQILTVSKFASFTPKEISLQLEITCSSISGATPPLVLETMKADAITVIDQDSSISADILDMTHPVVKYSLSSSLATGGSVAVTFTLIPNLEIPALGYIRISLPTGFRSSTAYPTCLSTPKNISQDSATSCTIIDGVLTLQLFALTSGPGVLQPGTGNFRAGLDSVIDITAGIVAPAEPGYYVFNFVTMDQVYGELESGTCGVTIQANVFAVYSFDSVHKQPNTPTIITLTFKTVNAVPQGSPTSSVSDQRGFLEVQLPTMDGVGNLMFDFSLGLTQSPTNSAARSQGSTIPCKGITGITAAVGYSLTCALTTVPTTAAAANNVVVTVSNFALIPAGTTVILHFAGVKHVQTAFVPTLTVTTYYMQNRRRTDLNTRQAALASTPASSAVAQTAATLFASTVTTVATSTILTGSIKTVTAIPAGTNAFLVYFDKTHDNGYCAATVNLVCQVNAITYACVCEAEADMVYIPVGGATYTAGTTYSLSLSNLFNPASVPPTADTVRIYTINSGAVKDNIQYTTALPLQTVGASVYGSATPSSAALAEVNVKYSLKFQVGHAVPAGGMAVVGFPTGFALHTSSPACQCVVLEPLALTAAGVQCTLFSTTVTLTNFQPLPALGAIQAEIRGVKNPSSGLTSGSFSLTTFNANGYLIDYDTNAPGFTFSAASGVGGVTISKLTAFPTNARANSEIIVEFVTTKPLPKGGLVTLTFPSAQYSQLPANIGLKLDGGLKSYQSISISGSQLKITTDADTSGSSITLYILGMANSDEGATGAFTISTAYDGVTLCQSGTQALITVPRAAPELSVTSWDFSPRNEGEKATFSFTVFPQANIEVDQTVLVTFPSTFDRRVGDKILCDSDYLTGVLECESLHAYTVQVSGHEGFLYCDTCRFTLNVYGVKNPPAGRQGYLSLGVFSPNSTYSEFASKVGPISTVSAPGYNNLWRVTASTQSCRMNNNLEFNMTTTHSVPRTSSGGAAWVVFPDDYDLGGADITCSSSKTWANGVPDCELYYDRVEVSGQEFDYLGTVIVTTLGIPNPLYEVTSRSIIAKTYDAENKKILDSSYANTNPNSFVFTYPGPLIVINNDQPIQSIKGTMTEEVPVTLSFPCALNVTLVPTVGDFCIVPYHVNLHIGQVAASFRVSVPMYLASGVYYIKWSLSGEVYPPYYTPIATTKLIVQTSDPLLVSIDAIGTIPRHGTSLPVAVSIPNAPDLNITVTISPPDDYPGLHLNATVLEFTRGTTVNYFVLTTENDTKVATAELTVSLSGPSSALYSLPAPTVEFSVSTQTGTVPKLSAVSSQTISRATASFRFSVTRPCMVYYESSIRGTTPPTFDRVRRGGPALYASSRSQYGALAVRTSGSFAVTGLMAGTKYTLFLWAEDLEYNQSPAAVTHDYETTPTYRTAESSLSFVQTYMTQGDIDSALNTARLLLSLDQGRLIYRDTVPGSTARRLTASTVLEFYITDDPSSDVYPTPKVLGDLLATKKEQLATMLSNFDSTWVIAGNEVIMGQCRFQRTPSISANHSTIRVTAQLADEGYLYGVCVDAGNGYPSSAQIAAGLDATNAPVPRFAMRVPGSSDASYTFTGLNPASVYKVFVTCSNLYPGYPELLPDSKVVGTSLKTNEVPAPVPIVLQGGVWLHTAVLVCLALF